MVGPEHPRHGENADEAPAWQEDTGPAMRFVAVWKHAVRRAEDRLAQFGLTLATLDLIAALSACFVPLLAPLLSIARIAGLAVFVPAVLRTLAIHHAEREDAELLKAIAIAAGVAGVYVVVRTMVVVQLCSL